MRIFQNEFDRWFKKMPMEELQTNFYMMSALFEKVGTGGGNFRRMYGQFLDEANKILDLPQIEQAAAVYTKAYRIWRQFSKLLEQSSESGVLDKDTLVKYVRDLYKIELKGINLLSTV